MKTHKPWDIKKRAAAVSGRGSILVLVLVAVAFCALAGVSYAKYIHSVQSEDTVRAQVFYFTSDLLDGQNHVLVAGTNSMTITLKNHADELRYSEVDVAYTVTVDNGAVVSPDYGTLEKGQISDQAITLSNLQNGMTYTVTATGSGGYHKTLTATFTVQSDTPVVYQYVDSSNSAYVLLTVWSQGYAGPVTIAYPDGYIPDNTDSVMATAQTNGKSFTDAASFTGSGYQSHTYRFFVGIGTDRTFTVTYDDDKTAETKGVF